MADDLRAQFDKFDTDGNGSIDEDEFAALVKSLGVSMTAEKVAVAFMAIDVDGNRNIEFGEFRAWWEKRVS
ncbi:MAG TPA: EF-hand domain-containing protein [Polyangiaceae bacterium]|nr:EF-hand domain-containing protein [Polyangiaceae bacterium]